MIKFNSIQVGIISYGGGAGIRSLAVNYSMQPIDVDTITEEEVNEAVQTAIADLRSAEPLAFVDALKAKGQFIWIGNGLEDKDYTMFSYKLFEELAKESLELQKKDELLAHQMRPPFFVFIGKPLVNTGSRAFYEQFNYLIVNCPLKSKDGVTTLTKANAEDGYSYFGLIEMANHNFSHFIFNIEKEDDLDVVKDVYLSNGIPLSGDRLWVIPTDHTNQSVVDACSRFAEENKLRLGVNLANIYKEGLDFLV